MRSKTKTLYCEAKLAGVGFRESSLSHKEENPLGATILNSRFQLTSRKAGIIDAIIRHSKASRTYPEYPRELGWLCMSYSVFGDPVFCALLGTWCSWDMWRWRNRAVLKDHITAVGMMSAGVWRHMLILILFRDSYKRTSELRASVSVS